MKTPSHSSIFVALLFLVLGLVGSCAAAGRMGGGFIEGGSYGHILALAIWSPALIGVITCLAIVTWTAGRTRPSKAEYPPGEDPWPFTRNLLLLILFMIATPVAAMVGISRS